MLLFPSCSTWVLTIVQTWTMEFYFSEINHLKERCLMMNVKTVISFQFFISWLRWRFITLLTFHFQCHGLSHFPSWMRCIWKQAAMSPYFAAITALNLPIMLNATKSSTNLFKNWKMWTYITMESLFKKRFFCTTLLLQGPSFFYNLIFVNHVIIYTPARKYFYFYIHNLIKYHIGFKFVGYFYCL